MMGGLAGKYVRSMVKDRVKMAVRVDTKSDEADTLTTARQMLVSYRLGRPGGTVFRFS